MKLLLKLSFTGQDFCGYQVQKNGRTVQKTLNDACLKLFGFPCDIAGCSRTDSGVHARVFYCTVTRQGTDSLDVSIDPSRIPLALNYHLKSDIAVSKAMFVGPDFHPRYSALAKTYRYLMRLSPVRDPFSEGSCWHVPYGTLPDATERMERALPYLLGQHDFSSFMAAGSKIEDPVRTVRDARLFRQDEQIVFEVSADGFLYHMVRIIAGTLVQIGAGQKEPEEMEKIILAKDRHAAGPTAPACGLYLWAVEYPHDVIPEDF
ncbi:MAG: tRNA pseudouridine(38-40) synthase TruA [Clostridia bacterium]|nr:tRNA pseudouridine(38-40) synthase TruA [Clostridia bacterium]